MNKKTLVSQRIQKPILMERAKVFACPEYGCRKKMSSLRDLNIHLVQKHKSDYRIEFGSSSNGSHAITVMR